MNCINEVSIESKPLDIIGLILKIIILLLALSFSAACKRIYALSRVLVKMRFFFLIIFRFTKYSEVFLKGNLFQKWKVMKCIVNLRTKKIEYVTSNSRLFELKIFAKCTQFSWSIRTIFPFLTRPRKTCSDLLYNKNKRNVILYE